MLIVGLSFLAPLVAAWLLARWACPSPWSLPAALWQGSLALGLALGLTSVTFLLWLTCRGAPTIGFVVAELTFFILLAGSVGFVHRRRPPPCLLQGPATAPRTPLGFALILISGCVLIVAGVQAWRSPHGDIDAWAIWNLRARFLYRTGDAWRDSFTPVLGWSHPDYPLLVPASVARCWTYAGSETTSAPQTIALLFAAATVGALVSTVALLRTPRQGYLAGIVLLVTPLFVERTTAQYADVPLAFFLLGSVSLFEIYDRLDVKLFRLPFLAGLLTGMAAWTKNEGQLVVVATVIARGLVALRGREAWRLRCWELLTFAAALSPGIGCLTYFKLCLAPANDLIEGQSLTATAERLTLLERYRIVAVEAATGSFRLLCGAGIVLPVYGLLLGLAPNRPRLGRHTIVVLVVMFVGYLLIYLTTPHDVAWQVAFSVDRLLLQLWPSALLLFFMRVATMEECRAKAVKPAVPPR